MKFTIKYEFAPQYDVQKPFWASAMGVNRCGTSYAEARERLIEDLREVARASEVKQVPPPDEEVEL